MATDMIKTAKKDGVFTITLNRPEKRNALNHDMCNGLLEAIESVFDDREVRIVVLRGEGMCFSAGIDFNMLVELNQKNFTPPEFRYFLNSFQRMFNAMECLEKPVIALLHNFCYGMGTEMALAADFRIATEDTLIGIQEVELGLIPDVGGSTRLTRTVGIPMAKEMIMAARVLNAADAHHIRLVNEVVPNDGLDAALERWVDRLSYCAPLAVGTAKMLIDRAAHLDKMTFQKLEGITQCSLLKTEDVMEGVMARMQKRKPAFKGK